MAGVLGVLNHTPEAYFEGKKITDAQKQEINPSEVESLIKDRETARKNKDWAKADEIRDRLAAMNILIEDRPEGTVWRIEK
jgi:cysteinyl-tRNA synthetase